MSQTRDTDRRSVDEFQVYPARYGADEPEHLRADIRVKQAAMRPVVTVEYRGTEWRFERHQKGVLSKESGPKVPSWVSAALRNTGVGEVA